MLCDVTIKVCVHFVFIYKQDNGLFNVLSQLNLNFDELYAMKSITECKYHGKENLVYTRW